MKKIIRFASVLAAATALFAGCQKAEETVKAPVDLTDAIVATYSAPTKVVDSPEGLVWEEEESIAVSMRGHGFIPYYMVRLDESRKTAWFRTDARADDANPFMDRNIAFSPCQEDAVLNAADGAISHNLPAVQEYSADGFLGRYFPMAGVTAHAYQTEFAFKNICGVLVLQLTGAGDQVDTIILRGNNKEPLHGAAVTKVAADNAPVIASLDPGHVKEYGITLDCTGSEVILGEDVTRFWFVIPPTTFEQGITVEVITTDGCHDLISTDKEVVVGRSEELVMDPVEIQSKSEEEDEYEAVDLGLSVKWATMNVGATKPEDYGYYFAWGETSPKNNYAWTNEGDYLWGVYQYGKPLSGMTKYTADKEGGDGLKTLLPDDDAATKNWGEKWRTPTLDEINELIDETKCKWTWDDQKVGYTVTSQINGKSIFLPAAGIRVNMDVAGENQGSYMSSSVRWSETSNAVYAHHLYFNSYRHEANYHNRCVGLSVRAVTE